jgi:DNA-binding phage protein
MAEWDVPEHDDGSVPWFPICDPGHLEDRFAWAVDQIRSQLPMVTNEQVDSIARLMLSAMDHADEEAFITARHRQIKRSQQAVGRRRAESQEKRHEILAAFHTAARADGDIDVDAIAKKCNCSRSTVYRALKMRPPGRSTGK